jgi:hypothetical protein
MVKTSTDIIHIQMHFVEGAQKISFEKIWLAGKSEKSEADSHRE